MNFAEKITIYGYLFVVVMALTHEVLKELS